jgi:hypothetical protein
MMLGEGKGREAMAQQGQGFDLSKVSTADKIILGGTIAFIVWTFLPVWYSCCTAAGVTLPGGGINGFHGTLVLSWFLALLAIVEVAVTKIIGTELKMPVQRGLLHIANAGLALLFTLLGLVLKPSDLGVSTSLSWGIFVGLALNLVWAYGAYMLYSEPVSTTPPPPSGTGLG